MGKLIHIKGDIFTSNARIIAHGCNCRGGYGSGVAGQIARRYPKARTSYINKFNFIGWRPGDVQFVDVTPNRIIANMATQDTFGGPGVHVIYEAVGQCFETLLVNAEGWGCDVAIPHIGAGLAGGDWSQIENIIVNSLKNYNVKVECYEY